MAMSTTGMVVTAAAVAGVFGAGAAALVLGSSPPPAGPAGPSPSLDALEERIQKQDRELQRLRAELAELRQGVPLAANRATPFAAGGPVGDVSEWTSGAAERALAAARAGEEVDLESLSADDRARFEALYNEMREKEQEEARRARDAQREAQIRGRLDRAQDTLGLSEAQKDTVVEVLMDRAERIRAALSEARSTGGPEAFREAQTKMAAIREETRRTLEASLTPEQMKVVEGFADRGGGEEPGRAGAGRFGGRRAGGDGIPAPGGRRGPGGGSPR